MPILKEEPNICPESLLDELASTPSDRQWLVLYTKARQEKALARRLFSQNVPFYLPLIKKVSSARGRKTTSFVPLFSGYVFLFGTEEERTFSLTTNRISRILPVADPAQLLFDLRQLRQLIASNVPLAVEHRLSPGKHVRVKHGPLAGLEGTVKAVRGGTRLLISIDFLQQGASVEIEQFSLEATG